MGYSVFINVYGAFNGFVGSARLQARLTLRKIPFFEPIHEAHMLTNDDYWNIIRTHNEDLLNKEAKNLDKYEQASQEKTNKISIINENWGAKLAHQILQAHISGQCRCSVYPNTHKLHAEHEEKYHFVAINNTSFNEKEWTTNINCTCKHCGKKWLSVFNEAGHSPTSKWY